MFTLPPSIVGSRRARKWLEGGEFGRLFDLCVKEFVRDGYGRSTFQCHVAGITHFLYWLKCAGENPSRIKASVVAQFLNQHLPRCRCAKQCARNSHKVHRALDALLRVIERLRGKTAPSVLRGTVDAELAKYDRYLKEVRGLTANTRSTYWWELKYFLSWRFSNGRFDSSMLTPEAVREFIQVMSLRRSHLRHVAVALRSYLRFKAVSGMQITSLRAAIPETPQWNLARLPKTLSTAETAKFLRSFDRTTASGQRDYAMARCMSDLGLRGGETARLQLDDIDWRSGIIRVRGKGQRVQVMPLSQDVGHALTEYIRNSRPKTPSRAIFMQLEAPVVAATADVVKNAIRQAARRSGLQDKIKGTHVLRHSIAGRLLSRGATLKGISDVLRHTSYDTTRIYLKIDFPALRRVAMPWVGRTV
jgi:site-specific recombinase XerD